MHAALDVIGFIPGIGDFADLVNAGIYILEGDVKNAIMSGVCALPLVGEMAGGAKIMSKVPKAARYVECTTKVIGHSANFIYAAEAGGASAVNIYHNAKDGNLLSWDTLKNAGVFGLSAVSMVFCGKQVAGSGKELAGMLKQDAPRAISKVKESVSSVGKDVEEGSINLHNSNRGKGKSGNILITHRGTNESIAQKLGKGYLEAHYPIPDNNVTRMLDHSKPAVWVSEGKPTLLNRIFSGMIGKRGEASISFEVDASLVKRPNGIIKRFFGKSQRVIEQDIPIPIDAVVRFGGVNK